MLGTLVNAGTVTAGTAIGRLVGGRLSEAMRRSIMDGLGLFTTVLGVSGALRGLEDAPLSRFVVVLVALVVGGLVGTALRVEDRIRSAGEWLRQRTGSRESSFADGFLTASVLFCVGPMTVLGSIEDGISGDARLLVIKSVLDGSAAVFLTAVHGLGVGASVLTILVVQGGLTLSAQAAGGLFTPDVLATLEAAGGLLILGIALKLLELRDVRVGNYLPALVLAPAGAALLRAV